MIDTVTAPALRQYRRLPVAVRDRLRWLRFPILHFARAVTSANAHGRVVSGPFRGMRWPADVSCPRYLLGTQELELSKAIEALIATKPDLIANVGAADGYYAVGLALRLPRTRVIGFEGDADAARRCAEVIAANGVETSVEVRGFCTAETLEAVLQEGASPLVVIDIEGGEIDVLDPSRAPSLSRAAILVETHDLYRPGCAETVRRRFGATHVIESIRTRPRALADFPPDFVPWLPRLAPRTCVGLLAEERGADQEWLILTPRRARG